MTQASADPRDYRTLVCITTCQRPHLLRRYLPHFAQHCGADRRFSLLVTLDGADPETIAFCDHWEVPLVYSDDREGVGMSKNRVLERFPDFDYYFFVEDDVELVDGSVFPLHVLLAHASGIHHFSLFEPGGLRKPAGESVAAGRTIRHGLFGGGQFGFYTGSGLRTVGGWHPRFAEFRRWGHTEHSYRFFHAGLAPAPFNFAEELADGCIWHHPAPVHLVEDVSVDDDQIPAAERELIDRELTNVPVSTNSPHHVNGHRPGAPERLAAALDFGERYPLVRGTERRRSRSGYHLWRARTATRPWRRLAALGAAVWNWPGNPALRHAAKTSLRA